ncbi:hypothetical protein HPB51_020130 [Rhipicephalus microplus]|uniref:Uncharacterized protein n=1 Tax=Rhipicephalus microplus TaxID=6941 RepID=A0A9J6EI17_RHIMP|nr:hypothetical protein HPB51_020130 [Rhipicephalus microplus]
MLYQTAVRTRTGRVQGVVQKDRRKRDGGRSGTAAHHEDTDPVAATRAKSARAPNRRRLDWDAAHVDGTPGRRRARLHAATSNRLNSGGDKTLSQAGEEENRLRLLSRGRNSLGETTAASIPAQGARDRHAETAMPVSGSAPRQPVRAAPCRWNAAVHLSSVATKIERGRRSDEFEQKGR